jgi:predicted MFS family arabinose efflux permease
MLDKLSTQKWYPWLVAIMGLFTVASTNAMTNAGISVFDESILKEFGWSVSELKLRDSITFLGGSVMVLISGWLVDKYGFKPFLLLGLALLATGYFFYSKAQSLTHFYLIHCIFGAVIACSGIMTSLVSSASWANKNAGLAIGITIAGTSVGGMILPPLATFLNQKYGWRMSFQYEALIPIVLFLIIFLLLKNKIKSSTQNQGETTGLDYSEVLKTKQFYMIAIAGALTYLTILSVFSHLFLYMRSLNFEPKQAGLGLSVLSFAGLTGKLFFGYLSDKINPFLILKVLMLTMFIGILGVGQFHGLIWVFLLITGFGWGGLHTLYNFILLKLFGLKAAGKVNGTVSLAEAAGGGLGIWLTGYLHDKFEGYQIPFIVLAVLIFVGCLSILRLREVE